MSHVEALASGTELVGDFRIEKVLGAGGFGITYLARETALDRLVAIKEYFPGDFAARRDLVSAVPRSGDCTADYEWGLERFISEAQVLAKFDHPNIVRVYRYFRANNTAYMVLHYEDGQSLKAWLSRLGRAPRQAELDKLVAPLLEALSVVHAASMLHRDIAPDNIIVRGDGSPVLIDFGAARGDIAKHSRTVSALVKPGYSPYEQYAEIGRQQGPWTDIYALAATLYHAVTGKRPPDAPSRVVRDELVAAREAAVSAYRARFLKAIDRGMRLDIEKRPQSVAEWRGDLLAPEPSAERSWFQSRKARAGEAVGGEDGDLAQTEVLPRADALAHAVPPPPDVPGRRGRIVDFLEGVRPSPRKTALLAGGAADGEKVADDAVAAAPPASPEPAKPAAPAKPVRRPGGLFSRLAKVRDDVDAGIAAKGRDNGNQVKKPARPPRKPAGGEARGRAWFAAGKPAPKRTPARAVRRPKPPVASRSERFAWLALGGKLAAGVVVAAVLVNLQQSLPGGGRVGDRMASGPLPPLPEMAPTITGSLGRRARPGPSEWAAAPDAGAGLPAGTEADATVGPATRAPEALPVDAFARATAVSPSMRIASAAAIPHRPPMTLLLKTFEAHKGGAAGVSFANGGRRLVTIGWDGTLKVWDGATFALEKAIELDDGPALSLAVRDDRALTGHESGDVGLWHLDLGMKLKAFKRNDAPIPAVAFAGAGRFLAGANDWTVSLWDVAAPAVPLHTFEGHERDVLAVAYHERAGLIASASADRTVKLWEAKSLSLAQTYPRQRSFITAIAFSPDGEDLLVGTMAGRISLYSTASRRRERRFQAHDGRVTSLAFAVSGGAFVSGSDDGTVRLWDGGSSAPRQTFGSAGAEVKAVAIAPDGRLIAAARSNGTVQIWNAGAVE